MAGVGTADEPAASGTSDRAAVLSGVSTGINMVLEMRDGDKSKLRDEGIRKAVVNIVDTVAHKLLGMDVWEQPEIDKLLVETLDGSKYDRCWFRANFSANSTLAIPTTVCRAGAPKSEVRQHVHLEAHRQVHDARALFAHDQWWKSCRLCVSGVLDCVDRSRQSCGGHDH